ncbi:MAG: hypothetical protein AB1611_20695 [bacterium]
MFFLIGIFTAAGCAHRQFRIPPLPSRGADLYPQGQNKKGLIIAVDDYFDKDKSCQAFGLDFTERNILVLEVIISNRSSKTYQIQSSEVLLLKADQIIYPLLASEAWPEKYIDEYLNAVELKSMVINPGETKHGLLYFRMPEEPEKPERSRFSTLWPYNYSLRIAATQVEGGDRLIYVIYLKNL